MFSLDFDFLGVIDYNYFTPRGGLDAICCSYGKNLDCSFVDDDTNVVLFILKEPLMLKLLIRYIERARFRLEATSLV